MKKTVIILSGGLDSTTLLYQSIAKNGADNTLAISFDYGQRHKKELIVAKAITDKLGVKHEVVDASAINKVLGGSALTDPAIEVPLGHYEDESMKLTVVPNRNMIFMAIATAWAISQKADAIAYGAHAGDHAIYPDCRKEFADAMAVAIALCDWSEIKLARPFVNMRKEDIVALGGELNVPYAETWSCYNGRELHCGECATCVERKEAFQLAGVADPTEYE